MKTNFTNNLQRDTYLEDSGPVYPEYKIVYGNYRDELEKLVNHWIKQGWEPIGGVETAGTNNLIWNQAMIKR